MHFMIGRFELILLAFIISSREMPVGFLNRFSSNIEKAK
jgi:hypothetical protein